MVLLYATAFGAVRSQYVSHARLAQPGLVTRAELATWGDRSRAQSAGVQWAGTASHAAWRWGSRSRWSHRLSEAKVSSWFILMILKKTFKIYLFERESA